ncbi:MAG: RagB/SusD family nutrient uptake outer membrane protein [Sphingobacterium composti]|uniref:RagB/SusD family nutrient uptake outer membrane protein n=1 Tax=Sphingobacterium composti TaxID=363260 RepID=UPI001358C8BE|nr:RagB/SusD family nutrient uptake outer membrane protein [Sphingobacterium composti Ten et al. 2007 non Yoo et al. 2007]
MINRKHIILSLALLTGMNFMSCEIDKEPLNGPTVGAFPVNAEEAEFGLLGAYKALTLLDASSTPFAHVIDNVTDVGYARPGNNYTPAITSSYTTDNAFAIKPWAAHYKTIGRVHTVLDNLEALKDNTPTEKYKQLDAELRFVRAYAYSQLIELYGDVPLLTKTLELNEAETITKTPVAQIQQWIINELTEVANALPIAQSASGNVRAGRVAAYMLKARVALYAKKYDIAIEASSKAMQLAEGVYALTPFNTSLQYAGKDHTAGEPNVTNIFGHEGFKSSKEWIWVFEYNMNIDGNSHNQQYYAASRLGKGVAYWGPTQDFIDSFQASDGLPITQSPLYNEDKPFANRDPRLDMYCVRPGARFLGYQFEMNTSFKNVSNYWPVINGTAATPINVANTDQSNAARSYSGYLWRKHCDIADITSTSVNGRSDLNIGIFRYAELLLLYAEAKIEANQIDATVAEAINKIRRRANMPEIASNLPQADMRKALRYERKIELASDGLRWYDIRRWGIAQDIMNGTLYLNRDAKGWKKNAITSIDANYSPKYNKTEAVKYFGTQNTVYKLNKDEYWPIPSAEISVLPKVEQNPGY